jgi:uncharacterized protein
MMDLLPHHLEIVKEILDKHVSEHEVRAFGSRVTGTVKEASDLDLVIMTQKPLEPKSLSNLKEAFSESDLPFKVDVVDWAATGKGFREIIESQTVVIKDKT